MSDPRMARAPAWAKHLHECMHETKTELQALRDAIGQEQTDERGRITGTGLTGRMIRTETKVLAYDRLKDRAVAAFTGFSVAAAILWWVIKAKVATALGVSS